MGLNIARKLRETPPVKLLELFPFVGVTLLLLLVKEDLFPVIHDRRLMVGLSDNGGIA